MASVPSIQDAIVFRVKATGLQLQRRLSNRGRRWPVQPDLMPSDLMGTDRKRHLLAESITPLWTPHEASERNLIVGKIQNLRVAVRLIHGVEIPMDQIFSFWAQVGKPTRSNGYVIGRELRQGCVIPSVGGGICQLSNALYSAALDAGFEIVERHAHSQIMPGSLAEIGRDATVFWNYIDLRFRMRSQNSTIASAMSAVRFDVTLTQDSLVVRLWGISMSSNPVIANPVVLSCDSIEKVEEGRSLVSAHTCQTCNVSNCFRNQPTVQSNGKVTAYLLDEYWVEFDRWIQSRPRKPEDLLMIPMDGKRWKKSNYAWTTTGFEVIKQARLQTLKRSLSSRKIPAQGGTRQNQLLSHDEALAKVYAQQLSPEIDHVVVTQTLLPFLWRDGVLGGRSFEVLMTRLPIAVLQDRLDRASGLHPESPTLKDFRANEALLKLEQAALQAAQRIITPHAEIANCFPDKSLLLNWEIPIVKPLAKTSSDSQTILFPASTLGRKGAYELRSVAQQLNLTVRVLGRELEGDNFWQNDRWSVAIDKTSTDLFANLLAVVLPAYVENHPKILLRSIALGIPVIATEACGLQGVPGVTIVKTGDLEALMQVVKTLQKT
jgi:VanW like protein